MCSSSEKLPAEVPGHMGYSYPSLALNQLSVSPKVNTKKFDDFMHSRNDLTDSTCEARSSSILKNPFGSTVGRNGSKYLLFFSHTSYGTSFFSKAHSTH